MGEGNPPIGRRWRGRAARRESLPSFREPIINNIRITAAALLAASTFAAQAQSDDAPTHGHFGVQFGNVSLHSQGNPVGQVTLGYDFDKTWSVEGIGVIDLAFIRSGSLRPGDYEFNMAEGVRGLATLPLGEHVNLVAGLGIVHTSEEQGTVNGNVTTTRTGPMVSLAGMVRLGRRWSLGVEVSSFTQLHTFNEGLRAEFRF